MYSIPFSAKLLLILASENPIECNLLNKQLTNYDASIISEPITIINCLDTNRNQRKIYKQLKQQRMRNHRGCNLRTHTHRNVRDWCGW